ncbi:MAG: MFS transporter [Candidatus Nealsonbacteria bacterium]|nr:MFS transporter [Candidatus Nealsonbacteria bacterium]
MSDFAVLFAWGLYAPILAIFVVQNVKGGDVEVAGIAVGIYWLVKSIAQIPIAKYLDRNHGEKDDYKSMVIGSFLASIVPIGFIFVKLPWHLYLLQIFQAIVWAMVVPAWGGIFTRHIDKEKEAFSWSIESSAIGIGGGAAGIIGGVTAKILGFLPIFIGASLLQLVSALLLLLISKDLLPKGKVIPISKPHP